MNKERLKIRSQVQTTGACLRLSRLGISLEYPALPVQREWLCHSLILLMSLQAQVPPTPMAPATLFFVGAAEPRQAQAPSHLDPPWQPGVC